MFYFIYRDAFNRDAFNGKAVGFDIDLETTTVSDFIKILSKETDIKSRLLLLAEQRSIDLHKENSENPLQNFADLFCEKIGSMLGQVNIRFANTGDIVSKAYPKKAEVFHKMFESATREEQVKMAASLDL